MLIHAGIEIELVKEICQYIVADNYLQDKAKLGCSD